MNKIKKLALVTFITLPILFGYVYNSKFLRVGKSKPSLDNYSSNLDQEKDKMPDKLPESVLHSLNSSSLYNEIGDSNNKDLRKFPYPYSSMLAISSDIDDTTLEEFENYHKFLNTKEQTPYGQGVGLDIGDSMWLYMANDSKDKTDKYGNSVDNVMTFFKGTDTTQKHNADEIIHFINAGWIDSLHTFGDFSTEAERGTSFNRKLAIDGWNTLKSINFKPQIWINHGDRSNRQNFGAYGTSNFMNYQQGDNSHSPYYHTDLTLGNGIKYVWNSISDYKFGHDYPLYELSLRDKRKVWGFYRYTNNIVNGKIDWTWTPKNLYRQLTQNNLDNLVKNQQYSIVTQHFGVSAEDLFADRNIKSLRLLEEYENNGKILVTKTSRLLNYANIHKYIVFNKITDGGKTYINIDYVNDPIFGKHIPTVDDIRGLTFFCDDPENTVLLINKGMINSNDILANPKDDTGKASISVKWFNTDYTDYTK